MFVVVHQHYSPHPPIVPIRSPTQTPPLPTWTPSPTLGRSDRAQALTMCSVHTRASADSEGEQAGCAGGREGGRWGSGVLPRSLSSATKQAGPGHTETLGPLQLSTVNLQKTSKWRAAKAP